MPKNWLRNTCFIIMLLGLYYTQQSLASVAAQAIDSTSPNLPAITATPSNTPTHVAPTPTSTSTPIQTTFATPTPTNVAPTPISPQPTSTPLPSAGADTPCTYNPWRFTTNMTTKRSYHAALAVNDNLYAFGGNSYPGVERAAINADGSLGLWQRQNLLKFERQFLAAVANNGYLYALGGQYHDYFNTTEYAKVNLDGSLSDWQLTTSMTKARSNFAAVVANGYLYAIGGDSEGIATVERAQFNGDGSLGNWEFVNQLNYERRSRNALLINNFIYVLGESPTSGQADSIERAVVNADGSLGAWQIMGTLPINRQSATAISAANQIYWIGGYTSAVNYDTVIRFPIQPTGLLGDAAFLNALHFARQGPIALVNNGHIYVIGGADYRNANMEESVEWAHLSDLTTPRDNHVSINGGALFTNQINVALTISGKTGAVEMQVSNDGGFASATWEPCRASKAWQITQFGSSILPRTVYLRYRDAQGTVSNIVQDDIILDVTAPSGSIAITPLVNQQKLLTADTTPAHAPNNFQSFNLANSIHLPLIVNQANCPQTGAANVTLQLDAEDDVSGVSAMLISNSANFTCAIWRSFTSEQAWFVPIGAVTTVYAKFRDNAGNISDIVQDSITLPTQ